MPDAAGPASEATLLAEKLRAQLQSPEFEPAMLPAAALEMIELSRDPDVSLIRIRELIEHDPALAARVLSAAQSPFYSRGNPVESLDDALVRLGAQRVTGIFVEAAMAGSTLQSKRFEAAMDQLRRHMTATAHIARGVCRSLKLPAERAFVCGLLHDIGIAGALQLVSAMPAQERPKDIKIIKAAVIEVHQMASGLVGASWNLPWGIQWVVAHHHSFWVDGRVSPLPAMVAMSDWLATAAGAGTWVEADEKDAASAADYFGFSQDAQERLLDRSKRIVEQLP